ncbi:hypothetical protein [Hoeflea poritis]|uniref:MFS transporter n=1 Tax=Hoeflea poritis TaxID=2993659 RepID=A0ABT4VHN7_9HYPH|nr:hypothetical protein [Hoeflea poritis]MDA4844229.1 hypothetical protein [Hoeflea poritis]
MGTQQVNPDEKRNLSVLFGQRALQTVGWSMSNPAVVLSYLAISMEMPILLAGLLVSVRRSGNVGMAVFGSSAAARLVNKKVVIARTDFILALCALLAIASVLTTSTAVVTATFFFVVLMIGMVEEYQNLINWDFLADVLESQNRQRLIYAAMGIGGTCTIAFTWAVHVATQEYPAFARHAAVVAIAVLSFSIAALSVLQVRDLRVATNDNRATGERRNFPQSARLALLDFVSKLRDLLTMPWFRRFLMIRLALQTVELSIPFFAILAAIAHSASHKGLTALIISSAAALMLAGPIWRSIGRLSNGMVMACGSLLAAASGAALVLNHYVPTVDDTIAHSAALFAVTVGVQGVTNARALWYLDNAPKAHRVAGLATSKSVVKVWSVVLAALMAALAHAQHIALAVSLVSFLNLCTAIFILSISGRAKAAAA